MKNEENPFKKQKQNTKAALIFIKTMNKKQKHHKK